MQSRILADVVVVTHLVFIVFAVLGGLLALRWRWAPLLHLPAAAWGTYVELTGGVCPLTPLENALRRAGGGAGYSGSFVDQYLLPVVYPAGLSAGVQLALAVGLVFVNLCVYALVFWRRRRVAAEPGAAGRGSRRAPEGP